MIKENDILNIWQHFVPDNNLLNAMIIAEAAFKSEKKEDFFQWSLEKLDAYLFLVRCSYFGNNFYNFSHCPACDESLDWSFDYKQLGLNSYADKIDGSYLLDQSDINIEYRLPNTNDLLSKNNLPIVKSCVVSVNQNSDFKFDDISEELFLKIQAEIEERSSNSNLSFNLSCPSCDHHWNEYFEISSYLISEIKTHSKVLLNQVHALSSSYGWDEMYVLEMSKKRRNYYLELINAS